MRGLRVVQVVRPVGLVYRNNPREGIFELYSGTQRGHARTLPSASFHRVLLNHENQKRILEQEEKCRHGGGGRERERPSKLVD